MGLFNSGKNEKVEKVNKYERHYNVPSSSSHRRSSKHRSHQGDNGVRAMSQPPLMRMAAGYYPPAGIFPPVVLPPMGSNVMSQVRYPISPFDLSKYPSSTTYSANPFAAAAVAAAAAGQMTPMSLGGGWNNGMALINNRSAFQQQLNDYQQAGWPLNNGYMPPMQF
ncbi:unnamed protein product [Rotaria sordida]|uniref:Uncharacterized protein n=1 Tax=Rotaria sordida TaxID=392033 RepID=A0A814I2N4_9BILA|nr:unnamed protein product [Rotaria sordida]CAF1130476.1 unnamed protein product [Rotaria sordida]CAF1136005.1 unnamed protein product [Rotaria sordida]CAF1326997.1 unnamed protein product [Rotaria sordida]CAF4070604.1 unnamed protein product [Rotaria sordida]